MKSKISFILFLTCFQVFSQKDSIVNFFDSNKKVITDKTKATTFEILTKQNDSIWLSRKYKRNGKLYYYQHYRTSDKKIKIGEGIVYNKHGKMIELSFYNEGLKHGRYKSWFDNGNLNTEGRFYKGKKEGLFKIYHYNGILAGKAIFKKDTITQDIYYDINGDITNKDCVICKKKPTFKGGISEYRKELAKLEKAINYKIDGGIYIHFVIDVHGDVTDVTIDEDIPEKLYDELVHFFESLKGWSVAIDGNRKVPFNYTQKINFKL
ncbi:hypothetical protein [Polaribacter atrinae]|uniref:hypothetical protein n=1 Tax=Polaribacter atrinae TaxID=1333662 RepID=UPI0030FC2E87